MKQHGKKLPLKKSDLKPNNYKYQINTETPKIPKKGWTQLSFNASRIIANAWEGDVIKNNYTIDGALQLEIATDKGTFSKRLPVSVYMDTLPF